MARTHEELLPLYRRLVLAGIVFAVAVSVWLVTLGKVAGALFLLGLVLVAGLVVVVGPRLARRTSR